MDTAPSPALFHDIASALTAEAGAGPYAAHIPVLARLLADVISGAEAPEQLKERVAQTPALTYLLLSLAGQQIPVGERILSFGRGESGRDAEIARAPFGRIEQSTNISLNITTVRGDNNTVINDMVNSLYIGNLVIAAPAPPPNEQSIAAAQRQFAEMPTDALPTTRTLPAGSRMERRRNPLFVGRVPELLALAQMIKGAADATTDGEPGGAAVIFSSGDVTASTGLGGIGKTQLANEFVHRYGQYFAGGAFWLSFAAPDLIPLEVADCGRAGRLPMRGDFHTLPLAEQVALVREAWQSEMPRLLVFDNCEDERLLHYWQPTSGGCRVLVTSRQGQWSRGQGVRQLPLGVLGREQSVELLRKFRPDLPADDTDLLAIAAALGDFPLALHLAGNYLAQYRFAITPAEYLARLRGPPGSVLSDESLVTGDLSPTDHIQHVARTFALSYEQLDPSDPTDATARLALARSRHLMPNEAIPYRLMQQLVAPRDTSFERRIASADAFHRLSRLGLLEADSETGACRLHGLLCQFVAGAMGEAGDERERLSVEEVMTSVLERPDVMGFDESLVELRAHLPFVIGQAFAWHLRAADYENALYPQQLLDPYLAQWGAYSVTIERNEQALRAPLADRSRVVSLLQLGEAYEQAGQDEAALERYEEALVLARDRVRRKDYEGSIFSQMGKPLERLGRLDEALACYERGLALAHETNDRNLVAKILINMGLCHDTLGEVEQAISLHSRAIALARAPERPPVSPDVLPRGLLNLASSLTRAARFDDAIAALDQAVEMARAQGDRALEAICLGNLGELYARCGDDMAEARLHEALAYCREFEQMTTLGNALHSCAETLIDLGRGDEAQALAREGLELGQARRDRQMTADNATALCRLALIQHALDEAAEVAAIASSVAPPRIAPYALTLAGIVALRQGDAGAALGMFERAVSLSGGLLARDAHNAEARDTRDVAVYGAAQCRGYAERATISNLLRRRNLLRRDQGSARRVLRLMDAVDGL